jgi:hypothetical protein
MFGAKDDGRPTGVEEPGEDGGAAAALLLVVVMHGEDGAADMTGTEQGRGVRVTRRRGYVARMVGVMSAWLRWQGCSGGLDREVAEEADLGRQSSTLCYSTEGTTTLWPRGEAEGGAELGAGSARRGTPTTWPRTRRARSDRGGEVELGWWCGTTRW